MQTHIPGLSFRPLTSRQARVRGVLMVIIGVFLVALTVCILGVLLDFISLSTFFPGVHKDPDAGPINPLVWVFIGFFTVFGLVTLAQGVYQIAFGARNRFLTIAMVVMFLIFAAAGILARALR